MFSFGFLFGEGFSAWLFCRFCFGAEGRGQGTDGNLVHRPYLEKSLLEASGGEGSAAGFQQRGVGGVSKPWGVPRQ